MATKIGQRTARILEKKEREVYKRLLIVLVIVVFLVIFLILWGLSLLVKFAEVLDIFQGQRGIITNQDTIPPPRPNFDSLPQATNSAQIKLSGFAEGGSNVEIFLNGQSKFRLLVGSDGNFEVDEVKLNEGLNIIEATATDNAGNKSQTSSSIEITFDKTKPALKIRQPNDGTTVVGQNNQIEVKGETEPGVTVTVNGFWAIVNQEGSFNYNYTLSEGENNLTIEASDLSGNTTISKRKVFYAR